MTCLAGPSLSLATLEAALVVEAVADGDGGLRSGQVQLPFLPAPAPESPTLTLTNQQPTSSLLLRGDPDVLAAMAVSFWIYFFAHSLSLSSFFKIYTKLQCTIQERVT